MGALIRPAETVETGVGVGLSRPFLLESESVKIFRLRLRPGFADPSTDDDIGRTCMRRLENVERQEEKESDSVEIKLKRHLVIKFGL